MHARQGALTVAAPVLPDRVHALAELLDRMRAHGPGTNGVFPFREMPSVHFGRWFLIHDRRDHWRGPMERPERPLLLVLSTNFTGGLADHLEEMFEVAGAGFNRLLSHCAAYPPPGLRPQEAVLRFPRHHRVPASAFYRGHAGRTVPQIHYEADLRHRLGLFLDEHRATWAGLDPLGVREEIREAFADDLRRPPPGPTRMSRWGKAWGAAGLAVGGLARLPVFLLSALFLRRLERRDDRLREKERIPQPTSAQSRAHQAWVRELADMEDVAVQNQLTHLVAISRGRVRRFLIRSVLFAIDRLARLVYDRGRLGGITSIHFARWAIVDDGRFLLFMSNYDGSWEDYLGEFIDRASVGLTAVWSNTVGFPHTEWLVHRGSRNANAFKAWARTHQLRTQVWYSAYPELTVRNVNENTRVRAGLYGPMTQSEATAWLALL